MNNQQIKSPNLLENEKHRHLSSQMIRIFILLGATILMFAAQCIKAPNILVNGASVYNYLIRTIMGIESVAIIAVGVTFVIIAGNNDMSTASLYQFSAVMACTITARLNESCGPVGASLLAIVLPLLTGLLVGIVNGWLVGTMHLNSFVGTLGMSYTIQGINVLFNGGRTANASKLPLFRFIGQYRLFGNFPFAVVLLFVLIIVFGLILSRTVFGRKVYAVGGNSTAAQFSGINSRKVVMATYMISGCMAAIAGIFVASWTSTGDMLMGQSKEFNAINTVVLGGSLLSGGVGSMAGTAVAALFLGMLEMFYTQFNISDMAQWFFRGLLMLAVIFINGLLERPSKGGKS